jgi:hypothetical protein
VETVSSCASRHISPRYQTRGHVVVYSSVLACQRIGHTQGPLRSYLLAVSFHVLMSNFILSEYNLGWESYVRVNLRVSPRNSGVGGHVIGLGPMFLKCLTVNETGGKRKRHELPKEKTHFNCHFL